MKKLDILNAWIMIEHLSEGDVKIDKDASTIENSDFFYSFYNKLANSKKEKNSGIIVYFDVFNFDDVTTILREKFNLKKTDGEIQSSKKFKFALSFDKNLKYKEDLTFYTVSGYIRDKKEVPEEKVFREFESEFKQKLSSEFEDFYKNNEKINKDDSDTIKKFNEILENLVKREGVSLKGIYIKYVDNLETGANNLHSFFIDDLEKAKSIETTNLTSYLTGKQEERINLESKKESENFDPSIFEEILSPNKYPLGRFPSNTNFALSFMQQVAVNLSSGIDIKNIRSVNGPPGTGKTTLLKDIFAELVVQQANEIVGMKEKEITGTEDTIYFDKASIGELPEKISEKNIIVASSNNGAVQNIVNELPLIKDIDDELKESIVKADYFYDIANKLNDNNENSESEKEKTGVNETQEAMYWGLFSLEGGKSANMSSLLNKLKDVNKYLKDDYKDQPHIYKEFEEKYKKIMQLRADKENFAQSSKKYSQNIAEYKNIQSSFENEVKRRLDELENFKLKSETRKPEILYSLSSLQKRLDQVQQDFTTNEGYLSANRIAMKNLEENKPKKSFLSGLFGKNDMSQYEKESETLRRYHNNLLGKYNSLNKQKNEIIGEMSHLEKELNELNSNSLSMQNEFNDWNSKTKENLSSLKSEIDTYENISNSSNIKILDLSQDYDELQLDNPWFDKDYRIAQSELFILALQVRKQFLYENHKNISAAINIWNNQNKYEENKERLANAAFSWINLVIPVISSTFASFAGMCRNLGSNTLGHLFIDEAGQALPQASVGAIYRSRNVMVVGDPAQIKPVLTMQPNVLTMLSKHYNVTEKFISESASTQTLVDATSRYGFYREKDKSEESWIGIPLWVHRRCQYPMFNISNEISYDGRMVQGNKKDGRAAWYDIKGVANNKYVKEQGDFLEKIIKKMIEENPKIIDKSEKDQVYVISPFSNVAYQLANQLRKIGFTRYNNGKATNVGTIHTFQGKEAPIVFMVLGADDQSRGAANWAVSEANMMNVAATRAKEEFYVIGDKKLYRGLDSEVVTKTYNLIINHQDANPEKYKDLLEDSIAEDVNSNSSVEKIKPMTISEKEDSREENIEPVIQEEKVEEGTYTREENAIFAIPKKDVENIQENSTLVNRKVESKSPINKINKRPTAKPKVTIEDTLPKVYKCSILINIGIKTSKNNTKFLMAYSKVDGKNIKVSIFENNPNYKKALEIFNKKDYKNNKILLQLEKSSSSNKYWNVTEKIIEN